MKIINTHGLAFIGPGSEWFWTAMTGVVLLVTFLAIYRQLRLQASGLIRDEMIRIAEEWGSERLMRARLAALRRLRSGEPMIHTTPLVWDACELWETVGALGRAGHLDVRVIRRVVGALAVHWWYVMAPDIAGVRESTSDDRIFEDYEWLVREIERGNPEEWDRQEATRLRSSPEVLDTRIRSLEERIREREVLRSVPAPPTSSDRRTAKPRPAPRQRLQG
jgi:hypothetical protein